MIEEEWRDIEGFEGKYAVSNCGRVKSLVDNHGKFREQILRPVNKGKGYLSVYLYKNGERKTHYIHRLVLSTFNPVENMDNLQVNHINEIKTDNRTSNLEWVTHKENINHGTRNDRAAEKMTNGKNSIPIVQLTLDGKYIRSWKSSHDAERKGKFNKGNIIQCCKNKFNREGNNIYKGYRWMYLSEYMDKYCGIID